MRAHVLLNLINELRKRGKMRGLPNILFLFRSEFNKFNNTGARILDFFTEWLLPVNWLQRFHVKIAAAS